MITDEEARAKGGWLDAFHGQRVHLVLLAAFLLPIMLVLFLDYFNVEAFAAFNQKFMFDLTWKGRMFYLFFAWLLVLETILDWEGIREQPCRPGYVRVVVLCVLMAVPFLYVIGVNFFGWNQGVIELGHALQIRSGGFIEEHWPLSLEYLVLAGSFIATTWVAYGMEGVKRFAIGVALLTGVGIMYLIDTIWPYGTFKPLQLLTLPTAAFATALLDLLGYAAVMEYPSPSSSVEYGVMPLITVSRDGQTAIANVAWPCAGVHSLLLFTLIILVFFKRTNMGNERKFTYFLIGAVGTYFTNILRIASFFIITVHSGITAGQGFHDSWGELYFMVWIMIYLIVMMLIQSGKMSTVKHVFTRGVARVRGLRNRGYSKGP